MSGKNINVNDKKIKKTIFYKSKAINNIEEIDVNNILVSKKGSYGNKNSFKYFIGYSDNDNIRPLCKSTMQMFINNNDRVSFKANKKYYPQKFLEECKYKQGKIKIVNHLYEDLENSESDSDSNNETESDIDIEE